MDKLDRKHDENNTLSVDALTLHSSLKAESFKPIRLEIAYDESITLAEALHYAIENNLAIKISRDNLNYQRYVLYGSIANALPNLSVAYNLTKTNILNLNQNAFAKVFLTRVTYPVFQGGSVAYSILGQLARAPQLRICQCARDSRHQPLGISFQNVVDCPRLQRFDGALFTDRSGQENKGNIGRLGPCDRKSGHPVESRQTEVGQNEIRQPHSQHRSQLLLAGYAPVVASESRRLQAANRQLHVRCGVFDQKQIEL